MSLLRFRIPAEHCSAQLPDLKPEFQSLTEDLESRIQVVAKDLLASDTFKGMKDRPVPAPVVNALKDSFHDMQHNVERRDAPSLCPETLQTLRKVDDATLKSGLAVILTAVLKMSQNLEAESAP